MTTTDVYQGMDTDSKPSSRVLNPPGGRSNFSLFGDSDPPAAAKPKRDSKQQQSNVVIGQPAQSTKPKNIDTRSNIFGSDKPEPAPSQPTPRRYYRLRDTSSFSTLGFGTGDANSAGNLAAQRAAYQKRNQASSLMFSGEDNSASASQSKVKPQMNEPILPSKVESPATNCNNVNPITNATSSPLASKESADRVSLKTAQKKAPEQLPAAGAKADGAWENSHRRRSNPPGGKSSITF